MCNNVSSFRSATPSVWVLPPECVAHKVAPIMTPLNVTENGAVHLRTLSGSLLTWTCSYVACQVYITL